MKKMLYVMHVSWGWIKQRPHFLAENLAGSFDLTVCFAKSYRKGIMTRESVPAQLPFAELFVLPFSRFRVVERLNNLLVRLQLRPRLRQADLVWLTHPLLYGYVKGALPEKARLVYDCMDDALEFPDVKADAQKRQRIRSLEAELVRRAETVFVSSAHLGEIVQRRYGRESGLAVLNNGVDQNRLEGSPAPLDPDLSRTLDGITLKKVMYIGTVASWLDCDLILKSLEAIEEIVYVVVGPSEVELPRHERLLYFSPVQHAQVFSLMAKADVLVMPFVVNDLILSVNPVKVYEYLYSGKPALVVGYGETRQFAPYLHLYQDEAQYLAGLRACLKAGAPDEAASVALREFVSKNTWRERTSFIARVLGQGG